MKISCTADRVMHVAADAPFEAIKSAPPFGATLPGSPDMYLESTTAMPLQRSFWQWLTGKPPLWEVTCHYVWKATAQIEIVEILPSDSWDVRFATVPTESPVGIVVSTMPEIRHRGRVFQRMVDSDQYWFDVASGDVVEITWRD